MTRSFRTTAVTALVAMIATGCWSVDSALLPEISRAHGIALTESTIEDEEIQPIASLQVSKSGFYLFGFAPLVEVSLHEAVDALAELAKSRGADGVCNLRYHYNPPHPLKFIVFPLPDWSASVQVFGMAYKCAAARRGVDLKRPIPVEVPDEGPHIRAAPSK